MNDYIPVLKQLKVGDILIDNGNNKGKIVEIDSKTYLVTFKVNYSFDKKGDEYKQYKVEHVEQWIVNKTIKKYIPSHIVKWKEKISS